MGAILIVEGDLPTVGPAELTVVDRRQSSSPRGIDYRRHLRADSFERSLRRVTEAAVPRVVVGVRERGITLFRLLVVARIDRELERRATPDAAVLVKLGFHPVREGALVARLGVFLNRHVSQPLQRPYLEKLIPNGFVGCKCHISPCFMRTAIRTEVRPGRLASARLSPHTS